MELGGSKLKEEIRQRILNGMLRQISEENYPLEFVKEDAAYFIGKRVRPSVRIFIEGITLLRLYAKLKSNKQQLNRKSLKKLEKKYGRKKYTRTVTYMYKVLRQKGYGIEDTKRFITFFFNFIRPDIMSNAGIFICLYKMHKNASLRKKTSRELKKDIPEEWLAFIDAFLSLIPNKTT